MMMLDHIVSGKDYCIVYCTEMVVMGGLAITQYL